MARKMSKCRVGICGLQLMPGSHNNRSDRNIFARTNVRHTFLPALAVIVAQQRFSPQVGEVEKNRAVLRKKSGRSCSMPTPSDFPKNYM
jgi:hypothetical protein